MGGKGTGNAAEIEYGLKSAAARPRSERIGRVVETLGGEGENLMPVGRDRDRVLELGRERLVLGHGGPAIGENLHLVAPGIDHRLDREEHAFAQRRALTRT